ncbi:hypothetical protein [Pectobacterium carotovorum]|uniref:hypothetical protein n=1 Tax=Pectobacterium carotovorum TaxID=554 RepID=UPI00057E9EFB|nr:hypothetical protein [Pectobacterium carotovorum]KHT34414.1 hypothetical protein RD01_05855 [Pectobacterium carotovorum subsp. carotovorum]
MNQLNESDFNEIARLLRNISRSNTKSSAKNDISNFNGLKNKINSSLSEYAQDKLSAAFICADEASGQVSDKESKIETFENELYKFQRIINKPF